MRAAKLDAATVAACTAAARRVIAGLERDAALLVDLAKPGADFVFVEEGVDDELTHHGGLRCAVADGDEDIALAAHWFGCGVVFMWLTAAHGIAPPAWWTTSTRSLTDADERCSACGDTVASHYDGRNRFTGCRKGPRR